MNKKLTIIIFFFIFFFLGNIKVKASDGVVVDFTYFYDSYKNVYENHNYSEYLLPLIEALEKENKNYIIMRRNSNYHLLEYSSSSTTVKFTQFSTSLTLGKMTFSLDDRIKTFSFGVSGALTLANYINENGDTPNQTIEGVMLQASSYQPDLTFEYNQTTGSTSGGVNCVVVYASNMSIKISELSARFSGIKFGDNIYRKNSLIPSYMSMPNYGKTYYTFNDNVLKNNNSQIKFNFEIPQDKMFSFFLNYSVTYGIGYATPPYLEVLSSNRKSVLPLDKVYNEIDKTIYADTQINSFNSNILEVSLVVDLEGLKDDSSVFIHFDSEYPFTYEYVRSYYTEVDWTGNYGIMLLPKLKQNTGFYLDIYSDVYFKGNHLTMKIYPDDYTDLVPLEEYTFENYNELWGGYKYYFQSSDFNYKLFFINDYLEFENKGTMLKYDTRYFTHALCSSKTSCETVKNPNTDEDITVKPPPENPDSSDNFMMDLINKFLNMIKEKMPILEQLPKIWEVFKDGSGSPEPPDWKVDLNGIGINKIVHMDFSLFTRYRDNIFFIIQLSVTYVTFKKLIDIIANYFD